MSCFGIMKYGQNINSLFKSKYQVRELGLSRKTLIKLGVRFGRKKQFEVALCIVLLLYKGTQAIFFFLGFLFPLTLLPSSFCLCCCYCFPSHCYYFIFFTFLLLLCFSFMLLKLVLCPFSHLQVRLWSLGPLLLTISKHFFVR